MSYLSVYSYSSLFVFFSLKVTSMTMSPTWMVFVFSLVTSGVHCGSKIDLVKAETFKPLRLSS